MNKKTDAHVNLTKPKKKKKEKVIDWGKMLTVCYFKLLFEMKK